MTPRAHAPDGAVRRSPDVIERGTFASAEVPGMVARGAIKDAMTVIALLHAARRLGR